MKLKIDLLDLPGQRDRRAGTRSSANLREPLLDIQQMRGLRRQPRTLFRHREADREIGAER